MEGNKVQVKGKNGIANSFGLDAETIYYSTEKITEDYEGTHLDYDEDGKSTVEFKGDGHIWIVQQTPEAFDYSKEYEKFSLRMLYLFDLIIEIANEVSDIAFTALVLYHSAPPLFWASVGFLLLSLVFRLGVGLYPLFIPDKKFNTPPIDKKNKFGRYWLGLLCFLLDPMTGLKMIHDSRLDMSDKKTVDEQKEKEGVQPHEDECVI